MPFKHRLRLFLIGFIPGIIILVFIVNKTGCTSPNELKMLELQYQHLQLGKKALCKLNYLGIKETEFKANLKKYTVDYDLSDVHRKPYGLYYLKQIDNAKLNYEIVIEDRDTINYIDDIKLLVPQICNCDTIH